NSGPSNGMTGSISVPNVTTSATAVTTSSSSESVTPSTPATAAAPQIEKPHAMSSTCAGRIFSARPMATVPKIPPTTMHTITASIGTPSETISEITNLRPKNTIPNRSSFFAAKVIPGDTESGNCTTLVSAIPSTMATINALTPGSRRLTVMAIVTATAQIAKPGTYCVQLRSRS